MMPWSDSNAFMATTNVEGAITALEMVSIHARNSASDGYLTNADVIGFSVGLFCGLLTLTVVVFLLERWTSKRRTRANRMRYGTQNEESGQRRTWWQRQRQQAERPDQITDSPEIIISDHTEPGVTSLRRERTAQRSWIGGSATHASENQDRGMPQPREQRKRDVSTSNGDGFFMLPQPALTIGGADRERSGNGIGILPPPYAQAGQYQLQDMRC